MFYLFFNIYYIYGMDRLLTGPLLLGLSVFFVQVSLPYLFCFHFW